MNIEPDEKNFKIICETCGYELSDIYITHGPKGTGKLGVCQKCGNPTFKEFTPNPNYIEPSNFYGVKCPFCQSTNCKKISGASKVGKVALFGVFSAGSVSKTWHCNNCGSNFG